MPSILRKSWKFLNKLYQFMYYTIRFIWSALLKICTFWSASQPDLISEVCKYYVDLQHLCVGHVLKRYDQYKVSYFFALSIRQQNCYYCVTQLNNFTRCNSSESINLTISHKQYMEIHRALSGFSHCTAEMELSYVSDSEYTIFIVAVNTHFWNCIKNIYITTIISYLNPKIGILWYVRSRKHLVVNHMRSNKSL